MKYNEGKNDNAGKIILSLLVGATAGVVAGLLLAPETGEETRKNLKDSANKLGDDVNKLVKKGQEQYAQAKTTATDFVEQSRATANEKLASFTTEAKEVAGKVTEQAKDLAGKVTEQAKALTGEAATAATETAEAAKDTVNAAKSAAAHTGSPQPTPKVDPIVAKAHEAAADNEA